MVRTVFPSHGSSNTPMIGVLVGNGLTISFCAEVGLLQAMSPSDPFAWEFDVPGHRGPVPWQIGFPTLHAVVQHYGRPSSFDSFSDLLSLGGENAIYLREEARHFLAMAYSHLQSRLEEFDVGQWAWARWLQRHRQEIAISVSLNYDSLFEWAGSGPGASDAPEFKPHGSIDHDVLVGSRTPGYPMVSINCMNDTDRGFTRLSPAMRLAPRVQPSIVLPLEASPFRGYTWVQDCYRHWAQLGPRLSHLVVIGISYARVDRVEIDYMLDCLRFNAVVIQANPNPSPELKAAVQSRGLGYEEWIGAPQTLV